MTKFGELDPDSFKELGEVDQADMKKCPHLIIAFEHYRPDGSCRCNDISHKEMSEWGYIWSTKLKLWVAF